MGRRSSSNAKKPIIKRPWFWPVVALVAVGAIGSSVGGDKKEAPQEPDQPAQSISNQSISAQEQGPSTEEMAKDYLSKQFELEVTDFKESAAQFEVTVSADGISDRNDQIAAPDDWQSIQLRMISAQARLSEKLEEPQKEAKLYLRDVNGDLMLSVQNGKIVFDKYEKEEEPPASSAGNSNQNPDASEPKTEPGTGNGSNFNTYDNQSQQQTTARYVLNTNSMKFHYPNCDSVPKIAPENYSTYTGTREGAISKGYDPCGKCNP